nr:unnamed protein product [Callosobruchus chinensis]
MYELYVEWCNENEKVPVKESYYRFIFCTEFNLKFHKPHSDTCNTCELTRKKLQKYWWKRLWSQMKMKNSTKTILLNLTMKTINILF